MLRHVERLVVRLGKKWRGGRLCLPPPAVDASPPRLSAMQMAAGNSMRHIDRLVVRPPDGHSGDGRRAGAPHAACMWQCWLMRGVPHGGSRFGCCCHDIVCCCELLLGAVAATARVCCCDELLLVVVAATARAIAVTSYCSLFAAGTSYCSPWSRLLLTTSL